MDYALSIEGNSDRFSPQIQREFARLGAQFSYRDAVKEVEHHLGVSTSDKTIQRYTNKIGELANSIPVRDLLSSKNKNPVITVQIDGGRVRVKGGWRETKTLIIENGSDKIQLTMIADHKTFMDKVKELVCKYGYDQYQGKICLISDGAIWIGDDFAEIFPHIEQVLDYYHFKEHLYDTAKILFGENNQVQIKKFVDTACTLTFENNIDMLLDSLEAIRDSYTEGSSKYESLRKLYSYLHKNRFRIRYGVFREHGLPIGSGKVEATIKTMNSIRLKSASTIWDEFNVQKVINLRTLIANNQWRELQSA
jgi:hypothetical protein